MVEAGSPAFVFGGAYQPQEVAGYLLATYPVEQKPPTPRRIRYWWEKGLIARQISQGKGVDLYVDFADLVTCQVIAVLWEAGFSSRAIRRAEEFFTELLGVDRPFAHNAFWHSWPDILAEHQGSLISGTRHGQAVLDIDRDWMKPLPRHLIFDPQTGRPIDWRPVERVSLRPTVQFGRPCIEGTRIPTNALWSYVAGGDSEQFVAEGYGIDVADVHRAVAWEEQVRTALETAAALSH